MAYTHAIRFTPIDPPESSQVRAIFSNCDLDCIHVAVNSTGHLGYFVGETFTRMGTLTVEYNNTYSIIVKHDPDTGIGSVYLQGQKLAQVSDFPLCKINQIGNAFTPIFPSEDRMPGDSFFPRDAGNPYTLPANGEFDEYVSYDRGLAEDEIVDLAQNGNLSKVYTLADYYLEKASDDGVITPMEKPAQREYWISIWNQDQRTTAMPTAIGSITTAGSYRSLAISANDVGLWTPAATGTPAYDYYQAIENWRKMFFDSTVSGFLLTSQANVVNDISTLSPNYNERLSALAQSEDNLRVAISEQLSADRADEARLASLAYTDELTESLYEQKDRVLVFYTQTADPSTSWTADEKIFHKGDFWRTSSSAVWKSWSGASWNTVSDPVALATANTAVTNAATAQSTANSKTSVFATIASAQSSALSGDMFLHEGWLYRATVNNATTATRTTAKDYGRVSSAPAQTTRVVGTSTLTEPLVYGSVYVNSTNNRRYIYTTSWVEDTSFVFSVSNYTPRYRGIGRLSSTTSATFTSASVNDSGVITLGSSATANIGDWIINYNTSFSISVYVWDGTNWTTSTDVRYMDSCATDIFNLKTGGISISGYTTIINAVIKNLMVSQLKLLSGGKLFSGTGAFNNANTPIFLGEDTDAVTKFSLGNKLSFNGTDLTISGIINALGGNIAGDLTGSGSIDFQQSSGFGINQIFMEGEKLVCYNGAGGGTYQDQKVNDKYIIISSGRIEQNKITSSGDEFVCAFDAQTSVTELSASAYVRTPRIYDSEAQWVSSSTAWTEFYLPRGSGRLVIASYASYNTTHGFFGCEMRIQHMFNTNLSKAEIRSTYSNIYGTILAPSDIQLQNFFIYATDAFDDFTYRIRIRNEGGQNVYFKMLTIG